jgi:RNA recognition motif-containing protein
MMRKPIKKEQVVLEPGRDLSVAGSTKKRRACEMCKLEGKMKLFVCGFSEYERLSDLLRLFEDYGEVLELKVRQGEKRKYALVTMRDMDAEEAIKKLNGRRWESDRLIVEQSQW